MTDNKKNIEENKIGPSTEDLKKEKLAKQQQRLLEKQQKEYERTTH